MIGVVIYNLLNSDSTITSLVAGRIFPQRRLQESELPAITYNIVSVIPGRTKDGVSLLDTIKIQINTWSGSYENAGEISKRVREILDRYSGINSGYVVDSIGYENETELYEDWSEVSHIAQDFYIRIKR